MIALKLLKAREGLIKNLINRKFTHPPHSTLTTESEFDII